MNKKEIKILLLGSKGCGKSSLGNFLLNDKYAFKTNDFTCTENYTEIKKVGNLIIIDTMGFDLDERKNNELINNIIISLNELKILDGILIVMNGNNCGFSGEEKLTIKLICNIFEFETFKNIGFVFTHFYGKQIREKIKERINIEIQKNN